jgi:predicted O-methyltransferase YrrM
MADRGITNPAIEAYAAAHTTNVPAQLAGVEADTQARFAGISNMLTGRLEGRFLKLLAGVTNARRVLEIGTFTGYSALSMAEGLAPGGTVLTLEVDPTHAEVARTNIAAAGFADRIDVREGPALDSLRTLEGPFELVFIDADKDGYPAYFEEALRLLAPNGLIVLDNMLRDGRVLDPNSADSGTIAITRLNDALVDDPRVEVVLLPVRDGVSLVRRRQAPV